MPKISVVMPSYNAEAYIHQAVSSILTQSLKDFELIIVDDCSSDYSLRIAESFKDSRIKIFQNSINQGAPITRNVCLSHAQGKYVAVMDADDIAHPHRLLLQSRFMDYNASVGVLGSWYSCIGNTTQNIRKYYGAEKNQVALLFGSPLGHSTTMLKNDVLKENQISYDTYFRYSHDYKLFYDLSKHTKIQNLPFNLLQYRVHNTNITNKYGQAQRSFDRDVKCEALKENLDLENSYADALLNRFEIPIESLQDTFSKLFQSNEKLKFYHSRAFNHILFDNWMSVYRKSYTRQFGPWEFARLYPSPISISSNTILKLIYSFINRS